MWLDRLRERRAEVSEDLWNFASVEAGSGDIMNSVTAISRLLAEGKDSLDDLAAVWGGTTSLAYQQVQMRWDAASDELNAAVQELANATEQSG